MSGGYASKKNMANGRFSARMRPVLQPKPMTRRLDRYDDENIILGKKKHMSWFKEKLRNWLFADENETANSVRYVNEDADIDLDDSINFKVIPAAGGTIIRVSSYDNRKDISRVSLHIVTPDEDMAKSLSEILALERLSK
jgi:hypothetical protein